MGGKKYLEGTNIEDLTGNTYGKLRVLQFDMDGYKKDKLRAKRGEIKQGKRKWLCKCECGKTTVVIDCHLKTGHTSSCGLCYTFEDWCIDNNHQDWLDLWDYEKNGCMPSEIGFGSKRKYWFGCNKGIHDSELWNIGSITSTSLLIKVSCRRCNSFGQYLLDTYGNLDIWGNENTVDPFTVAKMTNKKYYLVCKDCGYARKVSCSDFINSGIGCSCGDGNSYPNKFINCLLSQLLVEFSIEKKFEYSDDKRYDCYIKSRKCIIENHGEQHYIDTRRKGGRSLQEEQLNDKLKEKLARENGIKHYIALDCRKSELEWIKNSVMNSELPELLGFEEEDIDWNKCDEYATKNLVKEACRMWNSGKYDFLYEIGDELSLHARTIGLYLRKGSVFGWCVYDADLEKKKRSIKSALLRRKLIKVLKGGNEICVLRGCSNVIKYIKATYDIDLIESGISMVCTGKTKHYKGFMFEYIAS